MSNPETEQEVVLHEGKFLRLIRRGRWETTERVAGIDVATICPLTTDHQVVFVEQYRAPHQARCIEWPAGLVGDHGQPEDTVEAARRELLEETGFQDDVMIRIGPLAISCGLTNEAPHFFLALGCTQVEEGGGVDSEDITVHIVLFEEALPWLFAQRAAGKVVSANTIAGLYLLQQHLLTGITGG